MSRTAAANRQSRSACRSARTIIRPTFRRERAALKRGVWPVAGCDEAGRGPLAGPVVAAAVILDPERIPRGLNDSKKLDREEREKLYAKICATAEVAVAFGSTVAHRPRQHPARVAVGAGARGEGAAGAGRKLVFVDGRDRIDAGCDCEAVISRRRAGAVDRRGLDRRQGDARPADDAARRSRIRATASSATWATACRSISRRWTRLGPTIHHRRSFAPVAALLRRAGVEPTSRRRPHCRSQTLLPLA